MPPLEDLTELLFRQVHPNFVRDGRPSSQGFRPTPKDNGELSVARESLTSPEGAYRHYTEKLELLSGGTWAVSVGEALEQSLLSYPDPIPPPADAVPDPAHAIIDFVPVASNNQREAKAVKLQAKAFARGRLYPTKSTSEPPPAPESGKR